MNINQIKFVIKNKQKEMAFYQDKHEYFYQGKKFKSVSKVVEGYSTPFDEDGTILKNCARRAGIPESELKKQWEEKSLKGRTRGTEVHNEKEKMLLGLIEQDECVKGLLKEYKLIDTEVILFNKELEIAGQCDLILYKDDKVYLLDWKTNKEIDLSNRYHSYMKHPFDDLADDSYGHYTVQLNLYKYMLEEWGIEVEDMFIIHVNKDGQNIIPINKIDIKNIM